ncbi:NACHT domain-containing protein [Paractinoplanes rishiriensis]|uniref:NACHT domain-containing protein n=1 Tax=Paractinoplanes rishiriensis TaxID=1050105 RepID=A0A919MXZ8_9ACTN|nr:NACHT domain-containing protein [Actinoplanes rishiriensis]GIE99249.1 hypothetical protein Ari01nite_67140 [Actinoplanes rishiriensis]
MFARGDRRKLVWWVAAVAFLVALLAALASGPDRLLDTADGLASIGAFVVAVVALAIGIAAARRPGPPAGTGEVCRTLAGIVARRLPLDPDAVVDGPLRVRWQSVEGAVAAPAADVVGASVPGRPTRLRLSGDATDLAATWRQLDAQRVVIVGPPGAGKSTMAALFVRELNRPYRAGAPVAVLLSLAAWTPDPGRDTFDDWLPQQINERYGIDAAVATDLVRDGLIIPVLDGLDEIPDSVRGAALRELRRVLSADGPLLLTCRADEYEAAVEAVGAPLNRALVVAVEPVGAASAIAYLAAGRVDGAQRWGAVEAALTADPDGPLARVLGSPLLIYIAGVVHRAPGADPAGLVALPDQRSVEDHLFARYLPSVYREDPDRATARLAFLARHLSRHESQELRWWEVRHLLPRPRAGLAALAAAVVAAEWLLLAVVLHVSAGRANLEVLKPVLLFGAVAGVVQLFAPPPAPKRFRPNLASLRRQLFGPHPAPKKEPFTRRRAAELVLILAVLFVVLTTPVLQVALGYLLAVPAVVALAVGPSRLVDQLTRTSIDVTAAVQPAEVLRTDRVAAWLQAILAGLATAAVLAFYAGWAVPVLTFAVAALAIAHIAGLTTATGNYFLVRLWYGLRGRLPFGLLPFLADAHRRGVLRQNGAAYQFRHQNLQRYLAGL